MLNKKVSIFGYTPSTKINIPTTLLSNFKKRTQISRAAKVNHFTKKLNIYNNLKVAKYDC